MFKINLFFYRTTAISSLNNIDTSKIQELTSDQHLTELETILFNMGNEKTAETHLATLPPTNYNDERIQKSQNTATQMPTLSDTNAYSFDNIKSTFVTDKLTNPISQLDQFKTKVQEHLTAILNQQKLTQTSLPSLPIKNRNNPKNKSVIQNSPNNQFVYSFLKQASSATNQAWVMLKINLKYFNVLALALIMLIQCIKIRKFLKN